MYLSPCYKSGPHKKKNRKEKNEIKKMVYVKSGSCPSKISNNNEAKYKHLLIVGSCRLSRSAFKVLKF